MEISTPPFVSSSEDTAESTKQKEDSLASVPVGSSDTTSEEATKEPFEEAVKKHDVVEATQEGTITAKVKLLQDMGFGLSEAAARSMLTEMGGRLDLIVRALVANSSRAAPAPA